MNILLLHERPFYLNSLAEMHYNQWKWLVPERTLDDFIEKFKQHLNENILPSCYIAIYENQIIGSAALRNNDLDSRKELFPWLGGVLVKESFRGKSICKSLESAVCKKAKELGYSRLFLFTFDKESLYSHLHWKTIGENSFRNRPVKLMKKELSLQNSATTYKS